MTQDIEDLFLKNANSYTDSYNSVPAMTIDDFIESIKSIHPEFIKKIDWKLLREQKQTLETFFYTKIENVAIDDISGIIHLIDAIQDYACDEMELTEKEVFDLNSEEDD
jgi:hypothetical protein